MDQYTCSSSINLEERASLSFTVILTAIKEFEQDPPGFNLRFRSRNLPLLGIFEQFNYTQQAKPYSRLFHSAQLHNIGPIVRYPVLKPYSVLYLDSIINT
jgi:hypothetical protein